MAAVVVKPLRVTANKPAQLIEKSMASPSVLAMLLTIKYVDGLPLYHFETVLSRHGIEIPRQTLARVIQCSEHFQPLLNLMRDRLLESLAVMEALPERNGTITTLQSNVPPGQLLMGRLHV